MCKKKKPCGKIILMQGLDVGFVNFFSASAVFFRIIAPPIKYYEKIALNFGCRARKRRRSVLLSTRGGTEDVMRQNFNKFEQCLVGGAIR